MRLPTREPEYLPAVENIDAFLGFIEGFIRMQEEFIRVNTAFLEGQRKLLEAQIQVYRVQADILNQLPSYIGNLQQVTTTLQQTTTSMSTLVQTTTEFGAVFYENVVLRTLQSRDAFNLFAGGLELISAGIQGLQRFTSEIGNVINNVAATLQNLASNIMGIFDNVLGTVNTLGEGVTTTLNNLSQAVTKPMGALSETASKLGDVFSGVAPGLTRLYDSVGLLSTRVGSMVESLSSVVGAAVEYQLERFRVALTKIQATLAPLFLEIQKVVASLQMIGQAVNTVTSIMQVFLAPIGAAIGIFGRFANTWYSITQVVAEVQDSLNQMNVTLGTTFSRFVDAANPARAFSAAMNLIGDAADRANVSMQALRDVMQALVSAQVPLLGRTLDLIVDNIGAIAERIGRFPDEVARALSAWAARGDIGALQQLGLPLTGGQFQAWLMRRFGLITAPPFMLPELRIQFAREMFERFAPQMPTALVQFTQAMRTLGQEFAAMLASAEVVGGADLLRGIRQEIAELTRGQTGVLLRQSLTMFSTWIAQGIREMIGAVRQFLRSPLVNQIIEGVGRIINAIGRGVADALRDLLGRFAAVNITESMMAIAREVYAFIRAGIPFVIDLLSSLVEFLRAVFSGDREGRSPVVVFLSTIVRMISNIMSLGSILVGSVLSLSTSVTTFLNNFVNTFNSFANSVLTIGKAALIFMTGGLSNFVTMMVDSFARRVSSTQMEQILQQQQVFLQNLVVQYEQTMRQLPIANIGEVTNAIATIFPRAFERGIRGFEERYRVALQEADAFLRSQIIQTGETLQSVREMFYTFISEVFRPAIEQAQVYSELAQRLVSIFEPSVVRLGEVLLPTADIMESASLSMRAAIMNLMQRAFELWQFFAFAERLRFDPGVDIQQFAQQLFRNLAEAFTQVEQAFRDNFARLNEIVVTYIDAARLAFERAISRAATVTGVPLLPAVVTGIQQQISAALVGLERIGNMWRYLFSLQAVLPGIERLASFQRMVNDLLQRELELRRQIADHMERMLVFFRSVITMQRELLTILGGLGANISAVMEAFRNFFFGNLQEGLRIFMGMLARGLNLEMAGQQAARAISLIRQTIQREIGIEFAMVFVHLFRGEFQRAAEQLATAFQRTFESIRSYMETIRRQFEFMSIHLNIWTENFNELRGLLASIGAEMALFPVVLNQALPALIQIRRQFEFIMAMRYREGDILGFAEAHRNLMRIQRQIMELLGIAGMFLPAYTPEQVIRMMVAAGAPTMQEILRVARGGTLLEPLGLRAVPIPITHLYGFPAPTAFLYQPGIFTGITQAFWGMMRMPPQVVARGIGDWFRDIVSTGFGVLSMPMFYGRAAEMALTRGMAIPPPTGDELLNRINNTLAAGFSSLESAINSQTFTLNNTLMQIYNSLVNRPDTLPPEGRQRVMSFFHPILRLSSYTR